MNKKHISLKQFTQNRQITLLISLIILICAYIPVTVSAWNGYGSFESGKTPSQNNGPDSPKKLYTQSSGNSFEKVPFKLRKLPPQKNKANSLEELKIGSTDETLDKPKKKKKVAKKKPKPKPKPEPKNTSSFTNITLSTLGIYDVFNKNWGVETRIFVDTNYMGLPLEWQYLKDDFIRIRTWPSIYLTRRENPNDPAGFIALYTETLVKDKQTESSHTELGIGGGFSAGGFSGTAWLTTGVYQGTPAIKEIFNFRARVYVMPIEKFFLMFHVKFGTAVAEILLFTTSVTTFNVELELGYEIYQNTKIIVGAEIRTDNFGSLLDSKAAISGVEDALKALIRAGVQYQF